MEHELMGPPVELKNEDDRFGTISQDSIVREQIQEQDKVDWARTAVAGLGMGALFGPLGLLVAGGAAYAVQDKAKRDAILMEESRLRGARNLIDGTVEELDYLTDISKSYTGYGAEGFIEGDLNRLGLYRKQLARAQGDLLSGDPRRVEAGQAVIDQIRLDVAAMLDEDDRLAEKFEERRFNIREDQRKFVRDKVQQRLNVLENARADYESAIAVADKARLMDGDSAIAKAALWDYLSAPVQDAQIPGVAGIAGGAGAVVGAAGGPLGAGVGTLVGGVAGQLLSGGFTDEANPNEYSIDQLAQLAEAKQQALEEYTLGKLNPETNQRVGGLVNNYYDMAKQEHGFTREEVMYPDRTYNDLVREAGHVNHPSQKAPRTSAQAYNLWSTDREAAIDLQEFIYDELAVPPGEMSFAGPKLDTFVDTLRNGEIIVDRGVASIVADYVDDLEASGENVRLVPDSRGMLPDSFKFQVYRDGQWVDVSKKGQPVGMNKYLNVAVQEYRRERRVIRDALDQAIIDNMETE